MLKYEKPYRSLPQQIELLKERGLAIDNDEEAVACLRRNGYYRLSAYWYPFRKIENGRRTDFFLEESRFENARNLYLFDKDLKLLLLDALERIEIAVRVEIALLLGKRNRYALEDRRIFHPNFVSRLNRKGEVFYDAWYDKYQVAVRRARDEFVLHHEEKYGDRLPLPIWIGIELWDFGLLSHLYGGLKVKDQEIIAARFDVAHWQLMASWLRALNYVRNVIAHHSRLWNLHLRENPRLPTAAQMPALEHLLAIPKVAARIYSVCCILRVLSRSINPQSQWCERLTAHIESFPTMPHVDVTHMGFPTDWKTHALWQ